jgi:outer membrane cobalamin receptor
LCGFDLGPTIMRMFLSSISCAAILCALAPAAKADTAVESVVVTATRTGTSLADVPESVSLVSSAQIAVTPAKSLDEILRHEPSVNLPTMASYQVHPNTDMVSMRGLGGSRALVLLDGVPLNDPFFGYVQWNLVPLESVAQVEVVRGGGAALWGNYAMGGVIGIVTRVPDQERYALDLSGGSYGTTRDSAYAAFEPTDNLHISVDASTLRTRGYDSIPAAFHVPLDTDGKFQADNLSGTAQFDIDPTFSGAVRVGYHDTAGTLHTPVNRVSQSEWISSGDLVKDLGGSTLTATAFHIYARLRSDNSDTPPGGVAGVDEFVQNHHVTPSTSDGGSLVWSMTGDDWLRLLSAGADYQLQHGDDTGFIFSTPGVLKRIDTAQGSQRFAGAFVQAGVAPIQGLDILASARYQYFQNFDGFNGAPGGGGAVKSSDSASFDPRVSARYAVTSFFSLRAAYDRAFHAPTLNSLYRTFSNRFGYFASNASLKPETLSGWEVGFDLDFSSVHAQVTWYDSTVNNLLTTRHLAHVELPPGFTFGTLNINGGRARAQGAEAQIDWSILDNLAATAAYAYADSTISSNPVDPLSVGKQLGGVARQTASAQLTYTGYRGLRLAADLFWHDRFFNDNDHTLPIQSQFIVGLNASFPIDDHFEPYVQVQNLLDERNIADNAGTSAPQLETPRTIMVGVRAHFD